MVIEQRVILGNDILPDLTAHFRDFYSKPLRFRAPLPDFHLSSLSVSCVISLERPFLHQEIKNAVWTLGFGKASDIDGFPIEFFRTIWEACSADVFTFYDEFAYNSIFLKEFNRATCVLVPKCPNPTDVTHFHLISILGTPYKIIAKLFSLRLAPVLPSVINPFQVAFIKVGHLKAFDSVSWEFLSDVHTRLAFGPSFRQWILSLVTRPSLQSPSMGCMVISCVSVVAFVKTFSTIQYVDDFFLFGTATRQQIVRNWLILRFFELISGLSINSSKCHLSLIHADPATVLLAEACFGCKAVGLPMDYLGLQISLSPPVPSFWDGVEKKLVDRLQCWQRKLLSLPSRIILAKHCLPSVSVHALSVFRPVPVLNRFDRIIRNFIWDDERPLDRFARWDMVVFLRLLGGVEITNFSRACESSLCS
ncbi:uncharacterized protein LOC116263618 [Nymphaea colorata]|uniref:uncharacterized protein LOC116263618 n=1 Tax=Nymphaea colorata TaxID=210225 RepID=UPI00129E31E4|nr:uncharacterized protein LOC116263618 [Nymphaea colorata]